MIKQPLYALISLALLLVIGWFVIDRLAFLHSAQRTDGHVVNIWGTNSTCGGRRSRHSCTNFHASVEFTPAGQSQMYHLTLSAGSKRGHDQPVSYADRAMNQKVRVAYNPRRPDEAYEDTFYGIWGTPIMVFMFQIGSFLTSLTEPRRRRRYV